VDWDSVNVLGYTPVLIFATLLCLWPVNHLCSFQFRPATNVNALLLSLVLGFPIYILSCNIREAGKDFAHTVETP